MTAAREIGARLRAVREGQGLTLPEAAVLTGVARTTLASYERAARNISAAKLLEVAAGYGVHPAVLVSDVPVPSVSVDRFAASADDLRDRLDEAMQVLTMQHAETDAAARESEALRALLREGLGPLLPDGWWDRVREAVGEPSGVEG